MLLSTTQLCDEIRKIYRQGADLGPENIEAYLEQHLGSLPNQEKMEVINNVSLTFSTKRGKQPLPRGSEHHLLRFISLLLGHPVDAQGLDDNDIQDKLCASLDIIFNSLNELLQAISGTISQEQVLDETIRHVLRKQFDETDNSRPLAEYVDQIRNSFFTSYESFKSAHLLIIENILEEINPQKSIERTGALKFGALRKAEAFEHYTKLYATLKDWHDSGRGLEEYLRTFEKQCSIPTHQHKEKKS